MGLPRKLPCTWLAQRRPGPRGRRIQQVIEAGSADQQQPMRCSRARHGQAPEGGVELVEFGRS